MADLGLGRTLLDIEPCRYGYSRLTFRGPEADLSKPYLAFLGATETVGPFLTRPYAALVAEKTKLECANLGVKNAGLDVYLHDPEMLRIAQGAHAVVLEVMGALNLSNAFYKVHPRRNDRFIRAFPPLTERAPELDLVDVHFTGHLINEIGEHAGEVLPDVIIEVQTCWVERMRTLIDAVGVPVHLVHFVNEDEETSRAAYVDGVMLSSVAKGAASLTVIKPSVEARSNGTSEMFFSRHELAAATHMLSAACHREAARAILQAIEPPIEKARAG